MFILGLEVFAKVSYQQVTWRYTEDLVSGRARALAYVPGHRSGRVVSFT